MRASKSSARCTWADTPSQRGNTRATAAYEQRPVACLRGVGPALAEKLAKLGVTQVQDLLFVLPSRYEDRTQISEIGSVRPGMRAVVEGEIQLTEVAYRRRRQLLCRIADGTGSLTLRFFYFSGAQQANLARGTRIRCFGEVRRGPLGLEIVHPEYRRIGPEAAPLEEVLTPIYPTTEGVPQARLRSLIELALRETERSGVRDWIPAGHARGSRTAVAARCADDDASAAARCAPGRAAERSSSGAAPPGVRRAAGAPAVAAIAAPGDPERSGVAACDEPAVSSSRFLESLPFALTGAQTRALAEVDRDLAADQPMVRLVQGDVGCGKTVVAAAAAARAVGSGLQAALMAPTELLAEQHAKNFERWFRRTRCAGGADHRLDARAHAPQRA